MGDEGINSWLAKFKLKEEHLTQVQQELEKCVESVDGFEDLEQEHIDALEAFIEEIDGLVISKKSKLKKAVRSAWQPVYLHQHRLRLRQPQLSMSITGGASHSRHTSRHCLPRLLRRSSLETSWNATR